MPDKRLTDIILAAREQGASDVHITAGMPVMLRTDGELRQLPPDMSAEETESMLMSMLSAGQRAQFDAGGDVDLAMRTDDGGRQRVNVFRQRGRAAAAIRLIKNHIPTPEQLGLPEVLYSLADRTRGLILVTGPAGSGKSTTLASMTDYINRTCARHIITIEDPVEYVHERKQSLIHQREIGRDAGDFAGALRSALREDPDIILVGEMRDHETVSAALTAAETGHLVMATLHTTGAAQTIDRIVDAFPASDRNQISIQLAGVLCAVITQCLVPLKGGGGRAAATEVLIANDAVHNIIRENKCHQLSAVMHSGGAQGMHTLNSDLVRLVKLGRISVDSAMKYSNDRRELEQLLN